jgi:hypothetical protein
VNRPHVPSTAWAITVTTNPDFRKTSLFFVCGDKYHWTARSPRHTLADGSVGTLTLSDGADTRWGARRGARRRVRAEERAIRSRGVGPDKPRVIYQEEYQP